MMKKEFQATISNEELAELPVVQFKSRIVVVDHKEMIRDACRELARHPVIGFDTETRPAFQKGVIYKTALLQLSTPDVCFLFRTCRIPLERPILSVLENKEILKIGTGLRNDIQGLQALRHFHAGGFIDLQQIAPEYGIQDKSLRKMAAIVLGVRVSKRQRLTNWDTETLTQAQECYAATDAWTVLRIYQVLTGTE